MPLKKNLRILLRLKAKNIENIRALHKILYSDMKERMCKSAGSKSGQGVQLSHVGHLAKPFLQPRPSLAITFELKKMAIVLVHAEHVEF